MILIFLFLSSIICQVSFEKEASLCRALLQKKREKSSRLPIVVDPFEYFLENATYRSCKSGGGIAFYSPETDWSFLQNSVIFVGLFGKINLYFRGVYKALPPHIPSPLVLCAFCRTLLLERPENSPQLQIVATPYEYFLKSTAYMLKGALPSIRIFSAFCVISGVVSRQTRTKKSK